MRPVVFTSVLLLVVLMLMSDSAAWDPQSMCRTKYPDTPCKKNIGEGWFQMTSDRCVKAFYNTQHLGHSDAEMTCRKYPNGHLVSISNIIELAQVECAMYRATTGKAHYWIGLFKNNDQRWVWTDNTYYIFSSWANGQPDNFMLRESCVEMNYWDWGLWNDAACNDQKPYVCQVPV